MKRYIKLVDYIQYIYKSVWEINKSKSQIKRDIEQGAVSLNGVKLKADEIVEIDDGK